MSSLEILKKEFNKLKDNAIVNLGITIGLSEQDNYYKWKATLLGPKDSSYKGGLFYIEIIFSEEFPNKSPKIIFLTPIYHLNVNPNKNEKEPLGLLNSKYLNLWKPSYKVTEFLTKLYAIFYWQSVKYAFSSETADEYIYKRGLYEKKVIYFTSLYANSSYKKNFWDFSCNRDDLKHISLIANINCFNKIHSDRKINLFFTLNSVKTLKIHCSINDSTKRIVTKFMEKFQINNSREILCIFNNCRLIFDTSIANNNLRDKAFVTVIFGAEPD